MADTSNLAASRGFVSVFTLHTLKSRASACRTGFMARHGPHHAAQKSTSTGPGSSSTSRLKLYSSRSIAFSQAFAGDSDERRALLPPRLLLLVQFEPLAGLRPEVLLESLVGQSLLLELGRLLEVAGFGVSRGQRIERGWLLAVGQLV